MYNEIGKPGFDEKMKNLKFDSEGRFMVRVDIAGEEHAQRGHVNFKPEPCTPNIVKYVMDRLGSRWEKVERLEILRINGPSWVHFPGSINTASD